MFGVLALAGAGAWFCQEWRAAAPPALDGLPVPIPSLAQMPDSFVEGQWEYRVTQEPAPPEAREAGLVTFFVFRRHPLTAMARLREWVDDHVRPVVLGTG